MAFRQSRKNIQLNNVRTSRETEQRPLLLNNTENTTLFSQECNFFAIIRQPDRLNALASDSIGFLLRKKFLSYHLRYRGRRWRRAAFLSFHSDSFLAFCSAVCQQISEQTLLPDLAVNFGAPHLLQRSPEWAVL